MKKERGKLAGYNNCYEYKADHKKIQFKQLKEKQKQ